MIWAILALLVVATCLLAALFLSLLWTSLTSVPFVTSPSSVVALLLDMAEVGSDSYLVDLGSGDGRVVIAAARRGAYAVGYEIQRLLVWWSCLSWQFWRRWSLFTVQADSRLGKAVFVHASLWSADLSQADVVVIYGLPRLMEPIGVKLRAELQSGARVVVHAFPLPGWEPLMCQDRVYLYQVA
jgi:hypothetical protein